MNLQADRIKKGDTKAFGIFFRHHYSRLLAYCKIYIKEDAVAEDLVQEAFVNFWEKRKNIDQQKSVEALIFISVRNRCLNYLRDKQTARLKFEWYKSEVEQIQFLAHIDYLDYEEASMEESLLCELDKAMETLPKRCREIWVLSRFKGLKNKEVARQMEISVKAVEKQLSVAKSKIVKHLEMNFPGGLVLFLWWF